MKEAVKITIRLIRQAIFFKWFTIFKMKHNESFLITYSIWQQFYLKKKLCLDSCIDRDDERIAIIDKGRDEKFEILLRNICSEYVCEITKHRIDGTCVEYWVKYLPYIDRVDYSPMMVYRLIKNQLWMKI